MVTSLKREAIDGRPPPGVEPKCGGCMAVLSWWSESSG